MTPVTYENFLEKSKGGGYFIPIRWNYYKIAIEEAQKFNPQSILEIGANGWPLYPGCVTLDIDAKNNPTVVHDATNIPWPFENKQFDLLISLQTWEHFEGRQAIAFKEARRVCKKAILSFPYKWKDVDPSDCHYNLDETVFSVWTENVQSRKIKIGGRIMYIFDDL